MLAPLLFLALGCGPVHHTVVPDPPEHREAYHRAVDWSSAGDEAVRLLRRHKHGTLLHDKFD